MFVLIRSFVKKIKNTTHILTDSKKVGKIQHEDDWPPFPLLGYFLAKKESEAKIV